MMPAFLQLWIFLTAMSALFAAALAHAVGADWTRPVEIAIAIGVLSASAVLIAFVALSLIHPGVFAFNGGI